MLDDPTRRREVDPADALGDVEGSAEQWRRAAALAPAPLDLSGIGVVVVAGMGGSGIAGDVAAVLGDDGLACPVITHKGYGLPAWVGRDCLVVAVSYSGATEETLSAAAVALERGARLLAICSGGPLAALAEERGLALVRVPGGGQPRHSLGWLVVPLLAALGLDGDVNEAIDVLAAVAAAQGRDVPEADNPAKQLGARLASGGVPVAYGVGALGAVAALRLRCQLNENAKLPALDAAVPELCHNHIVGWEADPTPGLGLVWLTDAAGAHPRDTLRADLVGDLLASRAAWTASVRATGSAPLARLASLVLQADLASVYAAHARTVDPTPVASIDRLKEALAAVGS